MSLTIAITLSTDLEMLDLDEVLKAVGEYYPGDTVRVSRGNVDETRVCAFDNDPNECFLEDDEVKDAVSHILGELWMKALQETER